MTDKRDIMWASALAVALILAPLNSAAAQNQMPVPDGDHSKNLLDRPYLAPTGAVIPKFGKPQTGPETGQERKVQRQDDRITKSICSNC